MSMRKTISFAGLVIFLAITVQARAADLSGTWKGSFDLHGESIPLTLHLTQADSAVTGTVEGLPTTPAEIHDGKIAGDTLTFWLNTDYQGTTYKLEYTGKVNGDRIAFNFGTDDGSWSAPLTVTRGAEAQAPAATAEAQTPAETNVTGTWRGAFDFDGNSVPLTFQLTQAGGAVTGTITGLPTTPAAIHDGKIDSGTVTFSALTDYQGETYKLVFTGKIGEGKIAFDLGTEDGGWSTTLTATKDAPAGDQ